MNLRKHNSDISTVAYLNFALTLAKGLMVLLLATWALVTIERKNTEGVKPNAEYTIEVSWDDNEDHDLDTWLRIPTGEIVWFKKKEAGLINLDRDDTGMKNDIIRIDGKEIINPTNKEIISIRGITEGEYVLNVQLYRYDFGDPSYSSYASNRELPKPLTVKVEIKKMNPTVELVYVRQLKITRVKEEHHVCRFTMRPDGKIVEITNELPISLVREYLIHSDSETSLSGEEVP